MGKPLMIQLEDDSRIEAIKEQTGVKTKIEVVRRALALLEEQLARQKRIQRWEKAARIVGGSGMEVLKDFSKKSRFKKLP